MLRNVVLELGKLPHPMMEGSAFIQRKKKGMHTRKTTNSLCFEDLKKILLFFLSLFFVFKIFYCCFTKDAVDYKSDVKIL